MAGVMMTVLHDEHVKLGAVMAEVSGWDMPVSYPDGAVAEHLYTRRKAGLFDVSNMGRFVISGPERTAFLQRVLTNNCEALGRMEAQYTIIPDEAGGAVDDAYLYRFAEDSYMLVVGAGNAAGDLARLKKLIENFDADIEDRTESVAMISIQGPASKGILISLSGDTYLTEPMRNSLGRVKLGGVEVLLAKTGYTGESIGYEIFAEAGDAGYIWNALVEGGAKPAGLGARETLRIEAGLPQWGREIGTGIDGAAIPVYAVGLAKSAVSFADCKGEFIGRAPLYRQFLASGGAPARGCGDDCGCEDGGAGDLPCVVKPFCLTGGNPAGDDQLGADLSGAGKAGKVTPRAGDKVFKDGVEVGYVTSAATVPYHKAEGSGLETVFRDETGERSIGFALVRSDVDTTGGITIECEGGPEDAAFVGSHLSGDTPPYSRPILYGHASDALPAPDVPGDYRAKAARLIRDAEANHLWRQQACINLIPSEQSHSRAVRMLSILDPSFRYAEHRKMKSLYGFDVFYYQGTKFIRDVELMLVDELKKYFGCWNVETRTTSGQMANAAVFSALVDWKNRANRKVDAKRLGHVMNNHIIRGGHLSAQPMGALHDHIAVDPRTEKPAVVNFPVLRDNPYKIDVEEAIRLIEQYKPELIVFGKSMVLHKEPVAEIKKAIDELGIETTIMYDMAHVLGLVGPHFQDPFAEGADIVTGSTHKTFFGTQRGVIAFGQSAGLGKRGLWDAIESRVFPGSVSNHHLGTLLGLLMSVYEMNCFKDEYQKRVLENAKSFAKSLADAGLDVAGDPDISYTETHQVILRVGYATGAEIAEKFEKNNIIVNYQATPDEEGFTASGALRIGVSEMTRFGWGRDEFERAAALMADIVLRDKDVGDEVKAFRSGYTEMKYCFTDEELEGSLSEIMGSL